MAIADVDEVWEEMQREQQLLKPTKAFNISSLQREKPKPVKQASKTKQCLQSWSEALHGSPAFVETASVRQTEPPQTLIDAVEEIPAGTPETCVAYLQRDINCLGEDVLAVRIRSMRKLEQLLVVKVDSLSTDVLDAVADALLKPLLKRLKDKSEKCRELAVRILRSLVENTTDLSAMLPYVFPTLVARLGCQDLDGIAHLPEIARPDPEQKPTEIARPVEESEEIRLELARFVASLLTRCNQTQVYSYVDEATGLLRAQAMDPFHEVKAVACETMTAFCHNHSEMLLHFTEPLGRSLMSCLTHNHAQLRIAAMRTIVAVFHCGTWKHNFEVLQILMAWQDPNKVPVKAFYEAVTNVNYMSTLSFDRHPAVRRFWFETLAHILLCIPDKVDFEPYIFPYLITGLCDENEEIALEVFWLMEKCGELYEQEHETDLRKTKQYGFDYAWTYQGRAFIPFPLRATWAGGAGTRHIRRVAAHGPDLLGQRALTDHHQRDGALDAADGNNGSDIDEEDEMLLPSRDYAWPELRDLEVRRSLPRPRLGSRCWVRTHTRRYIKATFNDVVDFRDCTTVNAGRLLCMSLAYTEEGITEWLQPMFAALRKFYAGRAWAAGDSEATRTYDCVCKLSGVFLDPVSYWEQLRSALSFESTLELSQRLADVRILTLCIDGSVETLQSVEPPDPNLGMGRLQPIIPEMIESVHASDLLLSCSGDSRSALWGLIFSFLGPLRQHLCFEQVSQLLFVVLALASQMPASISNELAGSGLEDAPLLEEELLDSDKLDQALTKLSSCMRSTGSMVVPAVVPERAPFSFDSLDDDFLTTDAGNMAQPQEPKFSSTDPRCVHQELFKRAFPHVLSRSEDSFHVFRSVVYLCPLALLISPEHADTVLGRLSSFCGPTSNPATQTEAQALGAQLLLRCCAIDAQDMIETSMQEASTFMVRASQQLGQAQIDGGIKGKHLSYMVSISGLSLWRQLFLHPLFDPRKILFPPKELGRSKPLQWLTSLLADQELYKRFYNALEHAETAVSGQTKNDFVVRKARHIREEADRRAAVVRALAASTLLLVLRRMVLDGRGIPWLPGSRHGSVRAAFTGVASVFQTAAPTMDPPFVKATPPDVLLYAAELIHLLLHQMPQDALRPFQLLDDAAQAIHALPRPSRAPVAIPGLDTLDEREAFAANFMEALLGLNLTLPPDPKTRHAPAALEAGGNIALGWDNALAEMATAEMATAAGITSETAGGRGHGGRGRAGAVPPEVIHLLAQSSECLKWNAAMMLYVLGVDLAFVCQDGFQRCLTKWRQRKEQAKVLVSIDILHRAKQTLEGLL